MTYDRNKAMFIGTSVLSVSVGIFALHEFLGTSNLANVSTASVIVPFTQDPEPFAPMPNLEPPGPEMTGNQLLDSIQTSINIDRMALIERSAAYGLDSVCFNLLMENIKHLQLELTAAYLNANADGYISPEEATKIQGIIDQIEDKMTLANNLILSTHSNSPKTYCA